MTFDKLLVNMVESGEIVLTKSIRKNIQSESAVYVKVKVRDCDSRFQKKTDMFRFVPYLIYKALESL